MKTRLLLILSFLFLIVRGLFAWNGSGSSGDPYQITSTADWNTLASNVANGNTYSNTYFKLTADITVTTMISGTFSGTFDGNGHTLTVTLSGGGNRAPFQYLNGGTIKGLTVAGTVTASANYSSGLVARATGGTCLIDNCVVNANITGVGYIGGILAYNDGATSMTITNCIYGGTISITPDSGGANYTGGIFGWYNKTDGSLNLTIHNCLCKGTYTGNGQFHPIGVKKKDATFASKSCTNCFYTANPKNASGDRIFTSGTKVCKLTIGTDGVSIASGSYATFQNTKYYYGDITLAYNHADATVTYKLNGNAISGNSFTINTGTNFTSGTATITADVTYDITYNLDGGTLNAPQQTYTNPSTYKPTDAAITLRNPHKDGYAFYGWTGTGLTTGKTADRRKNVNVTIPSGSHGDRSYTADFREYTEGPWHFEGIQTGICTTSENQTLSYNGLIYNTIWMNPYPWQDNSGFGFTEWGTSATSGNKYGLYSIFTTNQQIPSYTRKVLHWNYDIASYADKFHQTVALYVDDDMNMLKALNVDMTADYTDQTGSDKCIGHHTQTTTSPVSQPLTGLTHDFEFDNRTGTSEQTLSKAMLMTQVIENTSSTPVEMHHWGGFKNMGMTWDTYYYKYVTFDANGGTGTAMAQLDVENSGTLPANTYTRNGYTFAGWSTSANGSVEYNDQATITADNDSKGPVTLYAQWAPLNNIVLTANQADGNYWTTFYCGDAGYKIDDAENAYAYTATVSESTITLHMLGKVIPKETAVIIVGEDNSISMTASEETVQNIVNNLHGVDVATPVSTVLGKYPDETVLYMLSNKNNNLGFYRLATADVPARKAFLALDNTQAALAPQLNMVFENATDMQPVLEAEENELWFTIDGRLIGRKPTQPGIYISKGKKIFVK